MKTIFWAPFECPLKAECSLGAFCNTFDLHHEIIGLENTFSVFFLSGCLRQVLLYWLSVNEKPGSEVIELFHAQVS